MELNSLNLNRRSSPSSYLLESSYSKYVWMWSGNVHCGNWSDSICVERLATDVISTISLNLDDWSRSSNANVALAGRGWCGTNVASSTIVLLSESWLWKKLTSCSWSGFGMKLLVQLLFMLVRLILIWSLLLLVLLGLSHLM